MLGKVSGNGGRRTVYGGSDPLEDRRDALAAADAHGGQRVAVDIVFAPACVGLRRLSHAMGYRHEEPAYGARGRINTGHPVRPW